MKQLKPTVPAFFTLVFILFTAGSYLLNDVWPIALSVNFRPHLVVFLFLISVLFFWMNHRYESVSLAILALLVAVSWAWTISPGLGRYELRGSAVQVGVFNPGLTREPVARAMEEARRRDLDIQILVEANPTVMSAIEDNREGQFTTVSSAMDGRYGMAVLSQIPIDSTRLVQFESAPFPIMEIVWTREGRTIRCWAIHPSTPVSPGLFDQRNQFFRVLKQRMASPGGPDLVVGDFNLTPSSPVFQSLVDLPGWSWFAQPFSSTWPAGYPWVGIRIDHLMFRDDLGVSNYEVGPHLGSDHYPVYGRVGHIVERSK